MFYAQACADSQPVCTFLYERTGNGFFSETTSWFIIKALTLALIGLLAWAASKLVRRHAPRAEGAFIARRIQGMRPAENEREETANNLHIERVRQRAHTLQLVTTSITIGLIWVVAFFLALDTFAISLAPLLAGAGVVGIAIGFGAQNIVADFFAGTFILLEDQYGVGDYVDLGEASGTVETVTLRATRLRDVDGVVWHVPNSQIRRVGNKSQIWSKAVLDIGVSYDSNLETVSGLLLQAASDVWAQQVPQATIIEEPTVLGVERFEADAIALRLIIKTLPNEQWNAARLVRARVKELFDEHGIVIPFPQRQVWLNT